jgi:hypothetical protein
MTTKRPVGFLNVDLDVVSSRDLEPLAQAMGKAVIVLYSGPGKGKSHFLVLEDSRWSNTPDAAALALCSAVERLSGRSRQLWDGAKRKEFNLGCDLIDGARWMQTGFRWQTLKRIVALGATVAFTCYRGESEAPVVVTIRKESVSRKRKRRAASSGSGRRPRH